MQNTTDSPPKTSLLSEKLPLILKISFTGFLLYSLWSLFAEKKQSIPSLHEVLIQLSTEEAIPLFTCMLLLLVVNWGLEAKKWQVLASPIEALSFTKAYQGVLVGLCLGFVTPANMGDFAGKIWWLKNKNKLESIGAILIGNGIQFVVTLLFTTLALARFMYQKQLNTFPFLLLLCSLSLTLVLAFWVYQKRNILSKLTQRWAFLAPYEGYIKVIEAVDVHLVKQVAFWSILRYLTFTVQFLLVLFIFHVNLSWLDLSMLIALILGVKTIVPTLNFLSDLGTREFSALYFFSFYSVNNTAILTATFVVWLVNILVPVLVGGVLVLGRRGASV